MAAAGLGEETDVDTLIAEIKLLRDADDKSILIVEGPTDAKFIENFVDLTACDLVIAWTKDKALAALNAAQARGLVGLLCLVDQDFDRFVGKDIYPVDVCVTDEHDLEMMFIRSGSLEKVLRELGSRTKLKTFEQKGFSLRSFLRERAYTVGILRLYSLIKQHNLKFEGLRYRFLEKRTLTLDPERMIEEVAANSRRKLDRCEVLSFFRDRSDDEESSWLVCCGHDFVMILSKALQHLIGSRNASEVAPDILERQLRLAYEREMFKRTKLFRQFVSWEQRNPTYSLFVKL